MVGLGTQAARKPLPLLSGASTYLANNHARERHGVKGAGAGSVEYQNILYWQIMLQTVQVDTQTGITVKTDCDGNPLHCQQA